MLLSIITFRRGRVNQMSRSIAGIVTIENTPVPAAAPEIREEKTETARTGSLKNRQTVMLAPERPSVPAEEMFDSEVPMADFNQNAAAGNGWALINLICLLLSLYILLPLLGLKAKFERASALSRRDRAELSDEERSYLRRFRLGVAAELLAVIAAIVLFILTQDLSARMVLADGFTPLMAALSAVCVASEYAARRERSEQAVEA